MEKKMDNEMKAGLYRGYLRNALEESKTEQIELRSGF